VFASGQWLEAFWVEGQMELNWLGAPNYEKHYSIIAYRCESCGFMKFYADADNSVSK
jgi:hypothetical protein